MTEPEKILPREGTRYIINPPVNIVGLPPIPQSNQKPLVGFELTMPDQKPLLILYDTDTAPIFLSQLIQAFYKMTGQKPKVDA